MTLQFQIMCSKNKCADFSKGYYHYNTTSINKYYLDIISQFLLQNPT